MPILTLHRRQIFKLSIPYWVFINEHPIGIMQGKEVSIELPPAQFELSIKILFKLFKWQFSIEGKRKVCLFEVENLHLMITDKERWWNILFDIDLVFWLIRFFVEFPYPWNIVYEVVSNGFFAFWLARMLFVRDRYFKIVEQNIKQNV